MIDWLKKLFSRETKDEQGSMDKALISQASGNKGSTVSSVNAAAALDAKITLNSNSATTLDAKNQLNSTASTASSANTAVHMEISSRIQAMVEEKGPQTAFQALLKELFERINNPSAVEYFSAYYEGKCSKKDILDKYDFLVKVEQDTLEGIASLGKQLSDGYEPQITVESQSVVDPLSVIESQIAIEPQIAVDSQIADVLGMVDELYKAEDTFCIYDKEFFAGVVGELISGHITPKQVQSKLWSKYFNFVKVFLDIGKKVGLAAAEQAGSDSKPAYEPVDEIEATLIKLLEAEDKAKAAVLKSK